MAFPLYFCELNYTSSSEASYTALFTGLKKRGLKNVWLAVSDAHQGLVSAIKKSFVGCSWQGLS